MSRSDLYMSFRSTPSLDALADQVSLVYVPTLTTIDDPHAILKHLATQEKLLRKKSEKVLSSVEGQTGACYETELTIEFLAGGGAYLPGLDDNFLADRVATFPLLHIVHFDSNHKIKQIRLYWDQGSLLKQLDVIGSRGRNWPIRDGKDQARLISSVAKSHDRPDEARETSASSQDPNGVTITNRAKSNSNAMNDPHATLSLFGPRDVTQEGPKPNFESPNVARRMSAKPPPRDYSELFGGGEEDKSIPTPAVTSRERSTSPSKRNAIPIKGGAGKHYSRNRLFDENDEPDPRVGIKSPERIKTDARKYNHFEFGDSEEVANDRKERPKSTHASQWDFEDFVTPSKPTASLRPNEQRHFGWSDDEAEDASAASVPKRPVIHQPRPDSKAHFEFADESTPLAQKTQLKSNALNKGLGLYENHITADDEDTNGAANARPKTNGTTTAEPLAETKSNYINAGHRRKDFGAHWDMTDASPIANSTASSDAPAQPALSRQSQSPPPAQQQKKTLPSQMQSHWALYDASPESTPAPAPQPKPADAGKENVNARGKTSKQTERSWDFGDEGTDAEGVVAPIDRRARRGVGNKTNAAGVEKSFWDF